MTRKYARLINLRHLVEEYGTITAVAAAAGTSEKYLGDILNGTLLKSGKRRQLGDRLAEKLENGCGKPPGWLDIDHSANSPTGGPALTPAEAELLRLFRDASPSKRRILLGVARL